MKRVHLVRQASQLKDSKFGKFPVYEETRVSRLGRRESTTGLETHIYTSAFKS